MLTLPVVLAVARRPRLWPAALRQLRRHVPRQWWRTWPPSPLPDRDWMAFRLTTAYGSPDAAMRPDDVITWLEWTETVRVADAARAAETPVRARAGRG